MIPPIFVPQLHSLTHDYTARCRQNCARPPPPFQKSCIRTYYALPVGVCVWGGGGGEYAVDAPTPSSVTETAVEHGVIAVLLYIFSQSFYFLSDGKRNLTCRVCTITEMQSSGRTYFLSFKTVSKGIKYEVYTTC